EAPEATRRGHRSLAPDERLRPRPHDLGQRQRPHPRRERPHNPERAALRGPRTAGRGAREPRGRVARRLLRSIHRGPDAHGHLPLQAGRWRDRAHPRALLDRARLPGPGDPRGPLHARGPLRRGPRSPVPLRDLRHRGAGRVRGRDPRRRPLRLPAPEPRDHHRGGDSRKGLLADRDPGGDGRALLQDHDGRRPHHPGPRPHSRDPRQDSRLRADQAGGQKTGV
ncbi:MAG: Ribulose-5-phosphate 4-epimerase and related epimerases and aldolases, partial [uncultured Rubrobacteraceae bacterium]